MNRAPHAQRYMASIHRTVLVFALGLAFNAQAQSPTQIGYESPRAAYIALSKDPSARLQSNAQGWQIVRVPDGPNEGIWTFAPQTHPSFPSVVKRQVIERDGNLFIGMDVLCGGSKSACDQYVAEFVKMNELMTKELTEKRAAEKAR